MPCSKANPAGNERPKTEATTAETTNRIVGTGRLADLRPVHAQPYWWFLARFANWKPTRPELATAKKKGAS
jgi:hypothetical protein